MTVTDTNAPIRHDEVKEVIDHISDLIELENADLTSVNRGELRINFPQGERLTERLANCLREDYDMILDEIQFMDRGSLVYFRFED